MMKSTLWALTLSLSLGAGSVWASGGGGITLRKAHVDISDTDSLQRGAQLFVNYCLSCHEARFMRYNRMGEDLGITDAQLSGNLIFSGAKVGQTMTIAMRQADGKEWFGTKVPDLSLIARSRGADWLYTYLTSFYLDEKRPFGVNNLLFKDVAMPHVLWELQGMQHLVRPDGDHGHAQASAEKSGHGTPHDAAPRLELVDKASLSAEEHHKRVNHYERQVRDLVNFLVYVGEPAQGQRLDLGWRVLAFLFVFFIFAYLLKREYWRDVH